MFRENSIETSRLSSVKQITSPGWSMRQVLRAGALGRPRRMGWRGRQEGGSGWETHVNSWLIHVNVWQKPLQYCKVISLQLINGNIYIKKKKRKQKRLYGFLAQSLCTFECVTPTYIHGILIASSLQSLFRVGTSCIKFLSSIFSLL